MARKAKDLEKEKMWHSASHVMAEAVKLLYPRIKFGIGPPIEQGFYYDFDVKEPFTPEDLRKIEKKMGELIAKKEEFKHKDISKASALKLFKGQPYKIELIKELPGKKVSIYTNGKFTDLCKGPHVKNSSEIGAVKLLKSSGAYWRGDERNPMLQRIYGIAFSSEKELKESLRLREEAEKRDHVRLARELDLFSLHTEAPGFPFIHNNGMILWNELLDFWREKHEKAGYEIINTPVILKKRLWETSGHWDHYRECMYFSKVDGEDYAIKPMNCPGCILIFKEKRHSYRDLPRKIAELGTVHRHEKSGVLHGLFRVRKFTQDDAHVFCTEKQVRDEIIDIIELTDNMYKKFGFSEYVVELSTRPKDSIGSDAMWKKTTEALEDALKAKKIDYAINEGEGAFYGPKIDFHIRDCLGRLWQCATIQLDFAMPERFDLYYIGNDDKKHRPAMIHRVVLGSIERFLGVLIEHYGGAFPLWLSPVQGIIVVVSDDFAKYAREVYKKMVDAGLRVELDLRKESVSKKVRDAELRKIPYILTVGGREVEGKSVAVRDRKGKVFSVKVDEFLEKAKEEIAEKK